MKPGRIAAVLLVTVLQTRPASAVVGPTQDGTGDLGDQLVMVLQRHDAEAGFCTGIVIDARAVLTAAHCVPPGAEVRIHFKDQEGRPVLLPVSGVTRHPGYRADAIARRERSIDLAVVTLPIALPERFRSATLSKVGTTTVGERFKVAGYGLQYERQPASSGHLREATLAARAPLSAVLLWAEDPAGQGSGACTGDSGGPILDGSGAVAAVTLWSAGTEQHQCGTLTQGLWLAPYLAWIAATSGR